MGKRGPKPRPTALKILEGCQPCRINRDEPKLPRGSIDPPGWLDAFGKEHWAELAPILAPAGLLSAGDRAAFAQLCDEYSLIRHGLSPDVFQAAVDEDEEARASNERATTLRRFLASNNSARMRYARWIAHFGLTPSSRGSIKAPVEKPKDDFDAFDQEFKKA